MTAQGSFDENELDNYSYQNLLDLKEEYVEKMEYDKVKKISDYMKQRKIENYTEALEKSKSVLLTKLKHLYVSYQNNCEIEGKQYHALEFETRDKIDQFFANLEKKQIDELIIIEKSYALEICIAKNKPVAKRESLLEYSRTCARQNAFQKADQLKMEAEAAYIEEHARRKAEIDDKYNIIRAHCYKVHKEQIMILTDKLKTELRQLEKIYTMKLAGHLKKFRASCIALLQRTIESLIKQFQSPEIKATLSNTIKSIFQNEFMALTNVIADDYTNFPSLSELRHLTTKSINYNSTLKASHFESLSLGNSILQFPENTQQCDS